MVRFLSFSVILCCSILIFSKPLYGQALKEEEQLEPDETGLPFAISEKRKLSSTKLASKREHWFVTGLPHLNYDPIQGIGVGADLQLYNNGSRDDPFFAYTPYRQRITLSGRYTQFGKTSLGASLDIPYLAGSKWRFRTKFAFSDNPNKPYFGLGTSSLEGLSYEPLDRPGEKVENARYSEYQEALSFLRPGDPDRGEDPEQEYSYRRFNDQLYTKYALDIIGERTLLEGRLRLVLALGFVHLRYRRYDFQEIDNALDADGQFVTAQQGRTLISLDYEQAQSGDPDNYWNQHNITGFDGGFSIKMKGGLIYDTRDFEPDPGKGSLIEFSLGYTDRWFGSDFSYLRYQMQWMQFTPLFTLFGQQSVLATRLMFSGIQGKEVFFREVLDIWSASQGRIGVFGGEDTMRGYRKFRFSGMIYGMGSIEMRTGLGETELWKQNLAFSLVPFIDFGRVWDEWTQINLRKIKYSPGMGLRIAWNQSTILRFDYARSVEDSQFFFVFGQMF